MSCASLPDTEPVLAATFLRLASDARRLSLRCQGNHPCCPLLYRDFGTQAKR
jgi:hypothetical protein